jgi:hypothetical protein
MLGSSAQNPAKLALKRREQLAGMDHLEYSEVILGYQKSRLGSRWLTHEEICEGVWEAIQVPQAQKVIGILDPWIGS